MWLTDVFRLFNPFFTDMEFERWSKRRRLYQEPSVSPTQLEETQDTRVTNLTTNVNPEDLIREDNYKEKVQLFLQLGLEAVSKERRKRKSSKDMGAGCLVEQLCYGYYYFVYIDNYVLLIGMLENAPIVIEKNNS